MLYKVFIFLLSLILFSAHIPATFAASSALPAETTKTAPIKTLHSVSPSWDSFTNRDGTGLYHEILDRICEQAGCTVTHTYTYAGTGVRLVSTEEADVYTCRDLVPDADLILGKYPMYASEYHVFFLKDVVPDWTSPRSMEGRSTAWTAGYYNKNNLPVPVRAYEAHDGNEALRLVLDRRIDFYLDDANLIRQNMRELGVEFDPAAQRIEPAGRRSYYPMFKKSPRGLQAKKLVEDGMVRLRDSGELKKIFEKWGHPYPY